MHLVGFIVRLHDDAGSPERQIRCTILLLLEHIFPLTIGRAVCCKVLYIFQYILVLPEDGCIVNETCRIVCFYSYNKTN